MQDVSWVAPDLSGGERSGPGFRRWVHNLSCPVQADFARLADETEVIFRKPLASPFPRREGFAEIGHGRL